MTFYYQRRNYATIKVRTDILYRGETERRNISGEWIIYGVEWDNPEKAPYKHKKIMDFFMEEKYLKTVCFLPSGFSLL